MLEIPESHVLAQQLNETIQGKIISFVRAGHTPHSFTWYSDLSLIHISEPTRPY